MPSQRERQSPFGPRRKTWPPGNEFRLEWRRPRVYRYMVSSTVRGRWPKPALNRYPGCVIGAAVVVGKHAYCILWGAPGTIPEGS